MIPEWVMAFTHGARTAELNRLIDQVPKKHRQDWIPKNNADRKRWIMEARRSYHDRDIPKERPYVPAQRGEITATECNAWLATLPPVPLV